jgi:hypothetical protein
MIKHVEKLMLNSWSKPITLLHFAYTQIYSYGL